MASNSDKIAKNPLTGQATGKAVLVDHYLFDELWMSGHKKIPEKVFEEEKINEKIVVSQDIEESKEVVNLVSNNS